MKDFVQHFAIKTINTTFFVTCVQIMVVDHVTVEWVASSSFQKCHFLENEFKLANQTPESKWRWLFNPKKGTDDKHFDMERFHVETKRLKF